jgi:hypothetical protein
VVTWETFDSVRFPRPVSLERSLDLTVDSSLDHPPLDSAALKLLN